MKQTLTTVKGKAIKNYILGDQLTHQKSCNLLTGKKDNNQQVSIIMTLRQNINQTLFLQYHNIILQDKTALYPKYLETVQSSNNIYIMIQKIQRLNFLDVKKDINFVVWNAVEFYRKLGEVKVVENEVYVDCQGKFKYLPLYKNNMEKSNLFYAQFHNKSVIAEIVAKQIMPKDKNKCIQIFLKYIDVPTATHFITKQLSPKSSSSSYEPINSSSQSSFKSIYPSLEEQEEAMDEQIMSLMSKVRVNNNLIQQAGQQYIRQSHRNSLEQKPDQKQIKDIVENVETSMFEIKEFKSNKSHKTKIQIKINQSKLQKSEFELYLLSYWQQLKFFKKCIKQFLSYYKKGFSGIISCYFLTLITNLRKLYLIRDLESKMDVFNIGVDMWQINMKPYIDAIRKEVMAEIKNLAELRAMIQNSQMPMKTYAILDPYLEQDISLINRVQLQNFTFFFLSALLKKANIRQAQQMHYLHVIDVMYILLHNNYEIVFFQDEFPTKWSKDYFEDKVMMIQAMLPNWSL